MTLPNHDPIKRALLESENVSDMQSNAMALVLQVLSALSPEYELDESMKERRRRARMYLLELADLLPVCAKKTSEVRCLLYAAERKYDPPPPLAR